MDLMSLPTEQDMQATALFALMTVIGALGMAAVLGLLRRRTEHPGLRALMSLVAVSLFLWSALWSIMWVGPQPHGPMPWIVGSYSSASGVIQTYLGVAGFVGIALVWRYAWMRRVREPSDRFGSTC